ncbi:MAG: TolC family protein, partial [Terracidiphilus sp.]
MSKHSSENPTRLCAAALALGVCLFGRVAAAQSSVVPPPTMPSPPTAADFQGGVTKGQPSVQPIDLSLDDAIQRGLQSNLGIILSGTQTSGARAARLSQLQSLLPGIDFTAKEVASQVDLPAEGLRIPGFPKIIGPFGYTDVRASLTWSLIDVQSLRNYLAARHNFTAAQLSAQDARDMVVLTVGNAYLLVLADQTNVSSVQAQVAT